VTPAEPAAPFLARREGRTDSVFVPAGWELPDHRVVADGTSDRRPLVCRFKVK
jgi:hypothetical protein